MTPECAIKFIALPIVLAIVGSFIIFCLLPAAWAFVFVPAWRRFVRPWVRLYVLVVARIDRAWEAEFDEEAGPSGLDDAHDRGALP